MSPGGQFRMSFDTSSLSRSFNDSAQQLAVYTSERECLPMQASSHNRNRVDWLDRMDAPRSRPVWVVRRGPPSRRQLDDMDHR